MAVMRQNILQRIFTLFTENTQQRCNFTLPEFTSD